MKERCATVDRLNRGGEGQRHTMAETVRRERMDWLVTMLKSAEPPIQSKRFIAVAAYNQAVSVAKIREYLDLLVDMEVLVDDGEELKWLG